MMYGMYIYIYIYVFEPSSKLLKGEYIGDSIGKYHRVYSGGY